MSDENIVKKGGYTKYNPIAGSPFPLWLVIEIGFPRLLVGVRKSTAHSDKPIGGDGLWEKRACPDIEALRSPGLKISEFYNS